MTRRWWVILSVSGAVVSAVLVIMLLNLRSSQPLRYRVDLNRKGDALQTVTLYYLKPDSLELVTVEREVLGGRTRRDLASDLVNYLSIPAEPYRSPLPAGTRLLNFFESGDGEAVMNFNAQIGFVGGDGILEEKLRLSALTRTLAENLGGIKKVRLLMLSRPLEHWGNHLDPGEAVEVAPS